VKTIIAGSRNFTDPTLVEMAVELARNHIQVTEVVSGQCEGIDRLGEIWATTHDIPCSYFPADWDKHGKAAGPIRNSEMVNYADALIAVWDGRSRGTMDVIKKARTKGLKVAVYSGEGHQLSDY
jgi:hypothetical protein